MDPFPILNNYVGNFIKAHFHKCLSLFQNVCLRQNQQTAYQIMLKTLRSEMNIIQTYSLPKRPGSHVRILVQTWLQIRTPTIQFTSIRKKVGKLSTKRCGIKTLYLDKHWMETFQGNISRIVWLNPHQSMNWIILSERSDNYLLHAFQKRLSSGIQTLLKETKYDPGNLMHIA